jgi:hypothetical protein
MELTDHPNEKKMVNSGKSVEVPETDLESFPEKKDQD